MLQRELKELLPPMLLLSLIYSMYMEMKVCNTTNGLSYVVYERIIIMDICFQIISNIKITKHLTLIKNENLER
jgi:hypothetical protein